MYYKNHIWIMLVSLAAGIACVMLNKIAPETIVIIIGTMFVAAGVINIAVILSTKTKNEEPKQRPSFSNFVTSLAATILGTWLIIAPEDNIALITRIISIIVILGSGYLLFSMLVYFRNVRFRLGFYILPAAILAIGIWMMISPMTFASFLVLTAGIILITYSIAVGLELLVLKAFERRMKKSVPQNDSPEEITSETSDFSV